MADNGAADRIRSELERLRAIREAWDALRVFLLAAPPETNRTPFDDFVQHRTRLITALRSNRNIPASLQSPELPTVLDRPSTRLRLAYEEDPRDNREIVRAGVRVLNAMGKWVAQTKILDYHSASLANAMDAGYKVIDFLVDQRTQLEDWYRDFELPEKTRDSLTSLVATVAAQAQSGDDVRAKFGLLANAIVEPLHALAAVSRRNLSAKSPAALEATFVGRLKNSTSLAVTPKLRYAKAGHEPNAARRSVLIVATGAVLLIAIGVGQLMNGASLPSWPSFSWGSSASASQPATPSTIPTPTPSIAKTPAPSISPTATPSVSATPSSSATQTSNTAPTAPPPAAVPAPAPPPPAAFPAPAPPPTTTTAYAQVDSALTKLAAAYPTRSALVEALKKDNPRLHRTTINTMIDKLFNGDAGIGPEAMSRLNGGKGKTSVTEVFLDAATAVTAAQLPDDATPQQVADAFYAMQWSAEIDGKLSSTPDQPATLTVDEVRGVAVNQAASVLAGAQGTQWTFDFGP